VVRGKLAPSEAVRERLPVQAVGTGVAVDAEQLAIQLDADLRVDATQSQLARVVEVERVLRTGDGVEGSRNARGW
jgi:hypothetical protein